jgi:hypothetical protein
MKIKSDTSRCEDLKSLVEFRAINNDSCIVSDSKENEL